MAGDEQTGAPWTPPGWSAPDAPHGSTHGDHPGDTRDSTAPGPAPGSAPALVPPPGWGGPEQQHGDRSQWGAPYVQAPRPGVVPLRPLGLGELLDGAVTVVRRYPRPTLGLSAVVAIVATVLNILLVLVLPTDLRSTSSSEDLSNGEIGGAVAFTGGQTVITALAGLVLSGVITVVIGKAVLGQQVSTARAWEETRPLLWRLVRLSLLTGVLLVLVVAVPVVVAVVLGVISPVLLIVGVPLVLAGLVLAVFLSVRLALASPALVLEKGGIRAALRRSYGLVRGAFWRTFGIIALATIIAAVARGVLTVPFQLVDGFGGDTSTAGLIAVSVGQGLALLLTQPFSSGVTALVYLDRRMRAEGLDVTLAAAAAAAEHGA